MLAWPDHGAWRSGPISERPGAAGNLEDLRVGYLEPDQVDAAGDILAEAFLDERVFSTVLCDDRDRRLEATIPFFRAVVRAHMRFGEVHGAWLGDELVGAAVRVPPEHNPMTRSDTLRVFLGLLPSTARLVVRCPGARHLIRLIGTFERLRPRDTPYFYLAMLGVRPDVQGRGIGGCLTRFTIDKADAAGAGCYFETAGEKTRALYEHRGFRVRDELTVFEGGPTMWTMWRDPPPRGASAAPASD